MGQVLFTGKYCSRYFYQCLNVASICDQMSSRYGLHAPTTSTFPPGANWSAQTTPGHESAQQTWNRSSPEEQSVSGQPASGTSISGPAAHCSRACTPGTPHQRRRRDCMQRRPVTKAITRPSDGACTQQEGCICFKLIDSAVLHRWAELLVNQILAGLYPRILVEDLMKSRIWICSRLEENRSANQRIYRLSYFHSEEWLHPNMSSICMI